MTLDLGISATNLTDLQTDFQNRVILTVIIEESSSLQVVAGSAALTVSSLSITNNVLTLTTDTITPAELTPLHSFQVSFSDNLYSTDGTMYTISTLYSFTTSPSDLQPFLAVDWPVLNFIALPFIVIALLFLLFMIRYSFYGWLEYLHCIQLLGLTLYGLFPYSLDQQLFAFMVGVDYANFSYIYNLPLHFISSCTQCTSLSGFAFIQGDMDYLRAMGSIL